MPYRPSEPTPAIDEVKAVYAELENRAVEHNCIRRTECCQFKLTGAMPQVTKGEAMVAAKALRATGRTKIVDRPDGACPLLTQEGKCMIYADRPFGCRTHFCDAAGGPASRKEVRDLIQRLEDIDHRLGGNGGVNLPGAVATAMGSLGRRR